MKLSLSPRWASLGVIGSTFLVAACNPISSDSDGDGDGADHTPTAIGIGSPTECSQATAGSRLLRRLTRMELENTLQDVFPAENSASSSELPGDLVEGILLSNDASTLLMGTQMVQGLLARAEQIASAVSEQTALDAAFPCATTGDAACVTTIVDQFGQRLFRRPVTDEERARFLALHANIAGQSDFYMGTKWTLVSLMQSPHTVYRSELGQGGQLTPYEVASELSYNFSASPPSDELIALAVSGGLDDPNARIAEARKLLDTERGKEVVRHFFAEWLTYEQAGAVTRTNTPENFNTIRGKMVQETNAFIDKVVYEKSGSLNELFTADYTVADADLAAFYGLAGGTGDLLAGGGDEVERNHGLGIFAQGSVLTTMASVEVTSPTRRGLLLLERLYCEVPGVPEAVNFDLTDASISGNTTRERLENSHLGSPACANCHDAFDPLGFAFEKFDHIGRRREQETNEMGTFDINDTTVVAKLDDLEVTGQEELMVGIAEDPEVGSCVSGTMERYVYGGAGTCRAPDPRIALMDGSVSIVDFLAQLAGEAHFVQRN